MIESPAELGQTREQLFRLEEAVADLRSQFYTRNPARFRLMAESYLHEITHLRARIDEYLGIETALELSSDVLVRLAGSSFTEGTAPASILGRTMIALQRGIQRIGEHVSHTPGTEATAPKFELETVAFAHGSFQAGFRVNVLGAPAIAPDAVTYALKAFSEVVHTASLRRDETAAVLARLLPDLELRLQVLKALRDTAPPSRGKRRQYDLLFAGRAFEHRVVFDRDTRRFLAELIRATAADALIEGTIREIDLDRRRFMVRTDESTVRCSYKTDLDADMTHLLNKAVEARGRALMNPNGSIKILRVHTIRPTQPSSFPADSA